MDPATKAATSMSKSTTRIGDAITTYATALDDVQKKLKDFEERAREFRTQALAGYEVSNWDACGWFGNMDTDMYGNVVPKDDADDTTIIPWNEHGPAVDKNESMMHEYNGLIAEISTAATTCATTIQRALSNRCAMPDQALTEDAMNATPEFSAGWGQGVEEDRNCTESVGHGLDKAWYGTWTGAASLIGYDDSTKGWSWETAGKSWWGVGDFALSTVLVTSQVA